MNESDIQGQWSGKLHGIEGWRANLELALSAQGNKVAGTGSLHMIADEHAENRPLSVEGTYDGEKNDLVLNLNFDGTDIKATISGHYQALEQHANAAIYGIYKQPDDAERHTAVIILWQFAS